MLKKRKWFRTAPAIQLGSLMEYGLRDSGIISRRVSKMGESAVLPLSLFDVLKLLHKHTLSLHM